MFGFVYSDGFLASVEVGLSLCCLRALALADNAVELKLQAPCKTQVVRAYSGPGGPTLRAFLVEHGPQARMHGAGMEGSPFLTVLMEEGVPHLYNKSLRNALESWE